MWCCLPRIWILPKSRCDTIHPQKGQSVLNSTHNRYIELSRALHQSPDGPTVWFHLSSAHLCDSPAQVRHDQGMVKIDRNEEENMDLLWTLAVILLVLWLLGLVTSYTLGGFIHVLLVVALIVVLIRVIQGRRPV
jgi:hypothetical protein